MFKIKFVAILLCLTTVFATFTGVSFADNNEGKDYELVIEDGKLISGNSDLIDQGIIVLGSPDDSEETGSENIDISDSEDTVTDSTDNTTAEGDGKDTSADYIQFILDNIGSFFKPVESDRAEIKDNVVIGTVNGTTAPQKTPNAVSPSAPIESVSAIALDNSISTKLEITASYLTASGSGTYYYMGQAFRYDNTNKNAVAWMDKYSDGIQNFKVPSAVHYSAARLTFKNITGQNKTVANNWNIVINGKTLEITTDTNRLTLIRSNNKLDSLDLKSVFDEVLKKTPMFEVQSKGVLRIVGPSGSGNEIVFDANGSTGSKIRAPILCVRSGGTAELKNVLIKESILDTGNYGEYNNGAGIYVDGGTLRLENVTFHNCETNSSQNGKGGAIYIKSGTVTIKDCKFGQNVAEQDLWGTQGGAIYMNSGNLTMEGGSAVNCHALNGTSPAGAFAYINGGTFNANGITVGHASANTTGTNGTNAVASVNGGAFYVTNGGALKLTDCTIQNCEATTSGGGIYSNGGKINITGKTAIKGNVATHRGGGMYLENSTGTASTTDNPVTITGTAAVNVAISGNKATNDRGGGICCFTSNLTISYATISKNTALRAGGSGTEGLGGGIYYNEPGWKLEIKNCTFDTNQSKSRGGGLYITGDAAGTIEDSVFKGNISGTDGGAIDIYSGATVEAKNTYFGNNKATGVGGAISLSAAGDTKTKLTLEDCYIGILRDSSVAANQAATGGGIYAKTDSTVIINAGVEICNNKATTDNGGGIYAQANSHIYINGTAESKVKISNNEATTHGGGMYLTGAKGLNGAATVEINYAEISGNTARTNEGDGGAIRCDTTNLKITNSTISDNSGLTDNSNGGAIDFESANYKLEIINCVFSGNVCYGWGGALYASSSAIFVIDNSTFDGNKSRQGGAIMTYAGSPSITITNTYMGSNETVNSANNPDKYKASVGGAIILMVGSLTIEDSYIGWLKDGEEMKAAPNKGTGGGGAIYVAAGTSLEIKEGVNISNNISSTSKNDDGTDKINGHGGGIYAVGESGKPCTVTIKSPVVINNNQAVGNGGGIYIGGYSTLTMTGGTIGEENAGNTARLGGGIYVYINGSIDLENTKVTYNQAKDATNSAGGGICAMYDCAISISGENGAVSHNTADYQGGGLYLYGIAKANNISINDITLEGNIAKSNRGGGIYIDLNEGNMTSLVTMKSLKFIGNITDNNNDGSSLGHGGGMYALRCNLLLEGCDFTDNESGHRGGGLYVTNAKTTVALSNCDFQENYAVNYGGALNVHDSGTVTITDCSFNKNTTNHHGGGIAATLNGKFSIIRGTISGNIATKGNGGGVYIGNSNNEYTIEGTEIYGNEALTDAPDMTEKGTSSVSDVGMGGGIYISGKYTDGDTVTFAGVLNLENAKLGKQGSPNKAVYGAGVALQMGVTVNAVNVDACYNEVVRSGGAYFVLSYAKKYGEISNSFETTLNIIGGNIKGNRALMTGTVNKWTDNTSIESEFGGGAVYVRGYSAQKMATLNINTTEENTRTLIEGNYSQNSAGAIYVHEQCNAEILHCDVYGNQGRQFAGAFYFPRVGSTANIGDCIFDGNFAGIRGGCMYINADGCTISDSVLKNNNIQYLGWSEAKGGAVYITSSGDSGYNVNLTLNSVDFIGNYVSGNKSNGISGGAIFAENNSATSVAITLSKSATGDVCKFIGNHATGNGGAIAISGTNTTLTMNGGYIIGNHAGDASTDVSESPYQKAYNATAGVGGGVAVFGGSKFVFNLDAAKVGAIYGNLAATAGDDVYANSSKAIKIPDVTVMTLYTGTLPENLPSELPTTLDGYNWYEDYQTGDINYGQGLNGNSGYIFRYRETPFSVLAPIAKVNSEDYVSITVGIEVNNTGSITITVPEMSENADPDQRFVYTIIADPLSGDQYTLTVSLKAGETVTITNLTAGHYTVRQHTSWSWRCVVNSIEQIGSDTQVKAGDSITFYLDCSEEGDTVDVTFTNSKDNNRWLSYNGDVEKNVAKQSVVYHFDFKVDEKRLYI